MKVLLTGSGGREHALAWKLTASPLLDTLYCAPGNPGMALEGQCVDIDVADHEAVIGFCRTHNIDLVVVGPEAPLVAGLADDLKGADFSVFGPSAAAAQLEGSKGFTKSLCDRYAIPTASYKSFDNAGDAQAHLEETGAPIVIKADGLAAGKGVTVAETEDQAIAAIDDCFSGAFGKAGASIIMEEYLEGEEVSFFCLCDGKTALPFSSAQDHKRAHDGDTGPNTGGMGAYSPARVLTPALEKQVIDTIIGPTMRGMEKDGMPFAGILYAGLMLTREGPKLIEYNVRFGDPECQVLMMRLKDDLLLLMKGAADRQLASMSVRWHDETALTVVLASRGYPGAHEKDTPISNIENAAADPDVEIFHAGTRAGEDGLTAIGGRVLNVTALGSSVKEAQAKAYAAAALIDWPGGFYRKDIGWREAARQAGSDESAKGKA